MRKRNHQIIIRLDESEQQHLRQQLKKTGLSQEAYVRMLISGKIPKATPPIDYYDVLRELHAIGNNLNQIAAKANALGEINAIAYRKEANDLRKTLLLLQRAIELPESM